MSTEKNPMQATKVITGRVRFSYVKVFEPEAVDGEDKKYSVSLLISKSDKSTIKAIRDAVAAATEAGRTSKFQGKIPASLKVPLRDGDDEKPDDEAYEGMYFLNLNASSKTKPSVINKKGEPITNPEEFYSGCYGKASVNFYAFNTSGNKGIACGLNNLLKLEDGESLGGRQSANDDFADDLDVNDLL